MRRRTRSTLTWLARGLFVLWLFPHLLLWSGIASESLGGYVSDLLSEPGSHELRVQRVTGLLPFYIEGHEVTYQQEEVDVRARRLSTWISPFHLFGGTLRAHSLSLHQVEAKSAPLDLQTPHTELNGSAEYHWTSDAWSVSLRFGPLHKASQGRLQLRSVTPDTLLLDLNEPPEGFISKLFALNGHPPLRLRADIRPGQPGRPLLALFRAEFEQVPGMPGVVSSCGEFAWQSNGDILLKHFRVEGGLGTIEGEGRLDPDLNLHDSALELHLSDSESLRSWGIEGGIRGTIALTGPCDHPHVKGQLFTEAVAYDLDTRVTGVRMDIDGQLEGERGQLNTRVIASYGQLPVSGSGRLVWRPDRLALEHLKLGAARHHLDLTGGISFVEQSYWFEGKANGASRWDLFLAGGGTLGEQPSLTLQRLSGTAAQTPFYLPHACTLSFSEFGPKLDAINLQVGESGYVTGSMQSDEEATQCVFTLSDIPASMANALQPSVKLEGTVNGQLALRDEGQGAQGSLTWSVKQLTFGDPEFLVTAPLHAETVLDIEPQRWELHADLQGIADQPSRIELSAPVQLGLRPLSVYVPPKEPLNGSLTAEGHLAPFIQPFLFDTNRVRGYLSAKLELAGSWEEPIMHGSAQLLDGTYESLYTGTTFTHIYAQLRASGSQVTLDEFTAKGGKNSRIWGDGKLLLDPRQGLPFTVNMNLEKSSIVKLDSMDATASGSLQMKGDLLSATIQGNVVIDQANLHIPKQMPKEIPTLDVVFVNAHGAAQSQAEPPTRSDPYPLYLDVKVEAPKDLFLSGRGLTSEWGGAFQLRGTTEEPLFYGQLNVQRGEFLMAGNTSELTSGLINMNGTPKKHIDLNLQLLLDYGAPEALPITISGPMSGPEIAGLEELSRLDAVHAAQVAVALAGGTVAPDILGTIRQKTGLDMLDVGWTTQQTGDIGEDDDRQVSIQVGKYLPRGFAISVAQTFAKEGAKTAVDLSLTKNLKMRAEIAQNADAAREQENAVKLQLKWRKDY